ncbi:DUF397 domain-containing protein [Saccharothrix violaceirubra]|uniref:DUF397 domain-containing protein n=1 Tax=Saccharothrix violaceirubra TaxID=413306 RepID=A0A7W7T3J2_9PSEU|nr:DUF397 domain-containing protein [Saccharothrix violaceirubra]MBB4964680.1 hypothetical protein [Saccharothrix violaceirubra]
MTTRWKKSSRSGGASNNCVEVADVGAFRDTKNRAVALVVGRPALARLLDAVRRDLLRP